MESAFIESMSGTWKPGDYRDEFRARLSKVIEKRMKSKGVVKAPDEDKEVEESTNVVDFMELLQKSIATKKRTPPGKAAKKTVRKSARPAAATKRRRSAGGSRA